MRKFKEFIKKETVLSASFILALVSCFFVPPTLSYIEYIDFRSLGILYSLMLVMLGFRNAGVFDSIGLSLLKKTKTARQLSVVLVLLCFVFSMFITNDVALITFVPFAVFTLRASRQDKLIMPVIVLQTIAANLGSMLLPMGNPQNLYLYQLSDYSLGRFVMVMLPYSALSLVMIMAVCIYKSRDNSPITVNTVATPVDAKKSLIYLASFIVCLLVVLRVVDYRIAVLVSVVVILILDRRLILNADYSLLMTFVFFFIFTGNLGNITSISNVLQTLVSGHETPIGILASQVISNVPATLLLSGFTDNYDSLLIGVNLGGLGTLIASMASLISYKQFVVELPEEKGSYFKFFTISNVAMLLILTLETFIL